MPRTFGLPAGAQAGVLIDGPHLWATTQALGIQVDFATLLEEIRMEATLVDAVFVTPLRTSDGEDPGFILARHAESDGFRIVTKPLLTFTDHRGRTRYGPDCSVEMALELVALADRVEHVILFCGDANLSAAVRAARQHGAAVTIVSTIADPPADPSGDLRQVADRFIDLASIRAALTRDFVPSGADGP